MAKAFWSLGPASFILYDYIITLYSFQVRKTNKINNTITSSASAAANALKTTKRLNHYTMHSHITSTPLTNPRRSQIVKRKE